MQFGFCEKHSIDHALGSLTESIRNSLDDKKFGCSIFIDLQKAFDTVNHKTFLDKLEHYGIREHLYNGSHLIYLTESSLFMLLVLTLLSLM